MTFIEVIIFIAATVLGLGPVGWVQEKLNRGTKPYWSRAFIMTLTSFSGSFVMFFLMGLTFKESGVLLERITDGLQFGFISGVLLSMICLFLYFSNWALTLLFGLFKAPDS